MSSFLAINNNNREAKKGTLIKIFFCVKYYLYQITSLEAAQKRGFRKMASNSCEPMSSRVAKIF